MIGIRIRIRHSMSCIKARDYASHIPEDGGIRTEEWRMGLGRYTESGDTDKHTLPSS
jgi:hypothetical protein